MLGTNVCDGESTYIYSFKFIIILFSKKKIKNDETISCCTYNKNNIHYNYYLNKRIVYFHIFKISLTLSDPMYNIVYTVRIMFISM